MGGRPARRDSGRHRRYADGHAYGDQRRQRGISGGQKQRLLIARALVGKPKILLFDEATSALDNAVQNEVAKNIARLGCTRIAIAHRLSTVRECDRIIMIDGGQIAEEGTYDELMERKGLFYEFAVRQI